jgi:hypothetical protein
MAEDMSTSLFEALNKDWPLAPLRNDSEEALFEALCAAINDLIGQDFNRLMSILYRIDVSEQKLRQWLVDNKGTDAARIIAHLIIDREKQKIRTRQGFADGNSAIPDEDKW